MQRLDADLELKLRTMPKAEIHVHLEGTIDAQTSYEIARRNGVTLPVDSLDAWIAYFAFRDFAHFIDVYVCATKAMQTPDDYALVIERFYRRQSALNVRYSEAFISSSLHLSRIGPETLLDAIDEGIRRGTAATGVRVAFIADISREQPDSQRAVLGFAERGRERGSIIGLGLGGLEAEFPPRLFRATYDQARASGLRVVAHAGEAAGAQSIHDALGELGAERIGHGVRVLEDANVVDEVRERAIPFEVCPHSNYALGIVARDTPHPLRRMHDAGLRCTVNSDDPAMFSTDLIEEYRLLAMQGFSWEELWELNCATLEATFLDDAAKAPYRAEWSRFAAGATA